MRENCEVNYGLGSVNETHERESVAETGYKWKEKRSHFKKKNLEFLSNLHSLQIILSLVL